MTDIWRVKRCIIIIIIIIIEMLKLQTFYHPIYFIYLFICFRQLGPYTVQ